MFYRRCVRNCLHRHVLSAPYLLVLSAPHLVVLSAPRLVVLSAWCLVSLLLPGGLALAQSPTNGAPAASGPARSVDADSESAHPESEGAAALESGESLSAERVQRYKKSALAEAIRQLDENIASLKTGESKQRQQGRKRLKDLLAAPGPPPPKLNVLSPTTGDIGRLPEPHQVLQVDASKGILLIRGSFRSGKSPKDSVHYFWVDGPLFVEGSEAKVEEGAVILSTSVFLVRDKEKPMPGGSVWRLERLDAKLLETLENSLNAEWKDLQEQYRRWK